MRVSIVQGSLALQKSDVVVNSTNQSMNLKLGRISNSIAKVAGPNLQRECKRRYPNGIYFGEIAITQAYNMKCKTVYHVALPMWGLDFVDPQELLYQTISECLQQAHKQGVSSISFPTLGCGFLNYSPTIVASAFRDCISNVQKSTRQVSIRDIYIVVYDKSADKDHILQAFLYVGYRSRQPERKGDSDKSPLKSVHQASAHAKSSTSQDFLSTCQRETVNNSCIKTLGCSHPCGGVRGETVCPPCLLPTCNRYNEGVTQTWDDDCVICYTDKLSAAPVIMVHCGHVFHFHCTKRILENRWVGSRINFNFMVCPVCKVQLDHEELHSLITPLRQLQDDVRQKAYTRLQYEDLDTSREITTPGSKYFNNPIQFALDRYIYYMCFKCKQAFYEGTVHPECEAEEIVIAPNKLLCLTCSGQPGSPQDTENNIKEQVFTKQSEMSKQEIVRITKPCPHCGVRIEKNGGCPNMICGSCNRHFVWDNVPYTYTVDHPDNTNEVAQY